MAIIEMFLKEMEQESATTRKMLERVPADKYDWQPHPKSMSLRRLATHVAELPSWVSIALTTDELDFATSPYQPVQVKNTAELIKHFEQSLAEGKGELGQADEQQLTKPWTLRNGDEIYSVSTKGDTIRMSLSQIIHHRAQLGVYLRLLNIPIPGSYGPSADEQNF